MKLVVEIYGIIMHFNAASEWWSITFSLLGDNEESTYQRISEMTLIVSENRYDNALSPSAWIKVGYAIWKYA